MGERQGERKMEHSLHEAAIQGKTASLKLILGEDPLILRRVMAGCFVHTPLHVAASEGHLEFVRELLDNNNALARVLDPRRWSALHLAAAKGHHQIVELLVEANANMCLTLDGDGRNPLHLAAMEGHVSVLRVFFKNNPHWIHELLKATDGCGNTILHLAVKNKKFEAVNLLLDKIKDQVKAKNIQKIDNPLNTTNKCGCTALDILKELKSSEVQDFKKVEKKFRKAGALKAGALKAAALEAEQVSKRQNALMVVASLIATMAFQAGVNPPGGVWQDDKPSKSNYDEGHRAGDAVISYRKGNESAYFLYANTIGFVASLSTILFLVTGLPFKKRLFTRILALIMCLTITSMAYAYAISIDMISQPDFSLFFYGVMVWFGASAVLVVIHTIPLLNRLLKVIWHIIWPLMKWFMKFILWSSNQLIMKLFKIFKFTPPSSNQPLPISSNGNERQPTPA